MAKSLDEEVRERLGLVDALQLIHVGHLSNGWAYARHTTITSKLETVTFAVGIFKPGCAIYKLANGNVFRSSVLSLEDWEAKVRKLWS